MGERDSIEARVAESVRYWQAQNPPLPRPFSRRHCAQFPDESRERSYRKSYGITVKQYEEMLSAQQGCCAICHTPPGDRRLAVDHCHTTKAVRGLLCVKCNTAIGKLNDDPVILQRAIDYLFFYQ